jgi:hypothetical protein
MLQYTKEQAIQAKHNKVFKNLYTKMIQATNAMLCILKNLLKRYEDYLEFECDFHNVLIYPREDKQKTTAILPFFIMEEDI